MKNIFNKRTVLLISPILLFILAMLVTSSTTPVVLTSAL